MGTMPVKIDENSINIIRIILKNPRSAAQISEETGIPIAAVFRRIKLLRMIGLIHEEINVIDIKGRAVPLYICNPQSSMIFIGRERSRITLSLNEKVSNNHDLDKSI